MNTPPPESPFPLPPPSPYSCSNCGFALQEAVPLCPNCGARIAHPRGGASMWSILGAVVLALLALPLGLAGACFAIFGVSTTGGGSTDLGFGSAWGMIGIGAGLLAVAALFIWGMIKLLRKR